MLAHVDAVTVREMRRDFERYLNDSSIAGRVARQLHESGMRARDGEKLIAQVLRRWESNPQRVRSDLFGLCLAHVDGDPDWEDAMIDWQERTGLWPTDWRDWYWGEADA